MCNLDKVVKFSNSSSKEANPPAATVVKEKEEEEEIVPTPIAEEKPKVEVKNTPTEKTNPTGNPKPYSPHYGSKRSGVWINEK